MFDKMRQRLSSIFARDIPQPVATKETPVMSQRMNILNMPEPPEKKDADFLEANRGWVYRAVDAIAAEVAKIELVLYQKRGGKITVIDQHPALDTLDRVNKF